MTSVFTSRHPMYSLTNHRVAGEKIPIITPPISSLQEMNQVSKIKVEDKLRQKKEKNIYMTCPGLEQKVNELKKKIGPPPPALISVEQRHVHRDSVPKTFKSPYLTSIFPKALC